VPPIVSPPSGQHYLGKPIFAELITPDIAASKQFYTALFGWTFQDVAGHPSPYAQATLAGTPVAGLVGRAPPPGQHVQPAWLNFISTTDVDTSDKIAVQAGARELRAPHDVPGRGREAVLADPQGAVFAILASTSGDPPDELAAPGTWIWRALLTTDPATDANFYKTVFGYQLFTLPPSPGETHLLLASEGYARASANSLPLGHANMHPHWLAFVRVDGVMAAVQKVTALGGKILVEPRVDRHGGLIAVVADPLGAPFGLMEWSDTESKAIAP
jgi:predicted enzyme related to lactoylglutathione lyase